MTYSKQIVIYKLKEGKTNIKHIYNSFRLIITHSKAIIIIIIIIIVIIIILIIIIIMIIIIIIHNSPQPAAVDQISNQ